MSDFQNFEVTIQPFDKNSYYLKVTNQSQAIMIDDDGNVIKSDGMLAYGVKITGITAFAYREKPLEDVTSQMIWGTTTVVDNLITVSLQWPEEAGAGTYKLTFHCLLDNGGQKELDADPVYVKDKRR